MKIETMQYLKAITDAFGPDAGIELDQKAWAKLHAAIKEALAQSEQDEVDIVKRLRETASKGVSVWGDLMLEAAKEIEIITAEREAYASSMERMKQQLKEPEQEPVGEAYLCDRCQTPFDGAYECPSCGHNEATKEPVYTTPPQHSAIARSSSATPLKPLTDEQIYEIHENSSNLMEFTRAIEAAHGIKEKNNDTW